jgi:hypothetical protein
MNYLTVVSSWTTIAERAQSRRPTPRLSVEIDIFSSDTGFRLFIGNVSFAATIERGQMRIFATREHRIAHHRAFRDLGSD